MSQGKQKVLKEEIGQLTIEDFITSTNSQTPKPSREHTRSRSKKRKTPPSLEKDKENQTKKYIPEHIDIQSQSQKNTTDMSVPNLPMYELNDDDPFLKAIERLLKPMRNDISTILKSHKELKDNLIQMTKLQEENVTLRERVEKIEARNERLSKRVSALEDRILQNNIIISGIKESPWETEAVRQEKLYQVFSDTIIGQTYDERMDIARTMHISGSRRIGTFRQMSSRPILVEMMYKSDAEYLLNNRRYCSGIYIDREYSKETEAARKRLRPYLKAARRLPKYRGKCRLDGDNLVLRGISYTVNTVHKLPDELQSFNVSSTTNEDTFGFFGSINPLSNFHPIQFDHEGTTFHCSEQLIQHRKAMFFGDTKCAKDILAAETALDCKNIARDINGFDYTVWEQRAKEQCKEGIYSKFVTHPWLQEKLLSTGTKTIVECCRDRLWGTGIPLHEENCLDQRMWESQGILGEILQEIRTRIKNHPTEPSQGTEQPSDTSQVTEQPSDTTPPEEDNMETSQGINV